MNTTNKLIIILITICSFNLAMIINMENKLENVEKMASEYFAPISDYEFEGEPQDGRTE